MEVEDTQVTISDVVYLDQLEVEMKGAGQEEGDEDGKGAGMTATGETEDLRAAVKGLKGEERLLQKRLEVVKRTQSILERFGCMMDKGRTSELKDKGEQPVRTLYNIQITSIHYSLILHFRYLR